MIYVQEDIKKIVKNAIKETLEDKFDIENITDETNLVQDLSFDSLSFIKLIVMLEDELDITFSVDALDIDSIERVSQLVEETYNLYLSKS